MDFLYSMSHFSREGHLKAVFSNLTARVCVKTWSLSLFSKTTPSQNLHLMLVFSLLFIQIFTMIPRKQMTFIIIWISMYFKYLTSLSFITWNGMIVWFKIFSKTASINVWFKNVTYLFSSNLRKSKSLPYREQRKLSVKVSIRNHL